MRTSALLALGAGAISTVSASALHPAAEMPHAVEARAVEARHNHPRYISLCIFGYSIWGGCQYNPQSTTSKSEGPCAGGAAVTSTYTANNGQTYGVCADTNLDGADFQVTASITFNSCAEACSNLVECLAATWDHSANVCHLKNKVPAASSKKSCDSWVKMGNSTSSGTAKSSTGAKTSSTTAKAASTTANQQKTTTAAATSAATSCGVVGYDKGNPVAAKTDFSGNYDSFTTCRAFCSGYQSFAFGNDACICYAGPVANNVKADANAPYTFYDMMCSAQTADFRGPASTPQSTTPKAAAATTPKPTTPAAPTTTKAAVPTTPAAAAPTTVTVTSKVTTTLTVTAPAATGPPVTVTVTQAPVTVTVTQAVTQAPVTVTVTVTSTAPVKTVTEAVC